MRKTRTRLPKDGDLPPLGKLERGTCELVLTKMLKDFKGLSLAKSASDGLVRIVANTETKVIYGIGETLKDALASVICESYLERP